MADRKLRATPTQLCDAQCNLPPAVEDDARGVAIARAAGRPTGHSIAFPVADTLGAVGRSLDPGEVKSQLQVQTPIGREWPSAKPGRLVCDEQANNQDCGRTVLSTVVICG